MAPTRPFPDLDWQVTPEPVRQYIRFLESALSRMHQQVQSHEQRIEKLEVRTQKNSKNSSKPPSSDSPYTRGGDRKKKGNMTPMA